jgi:UDP-GlcNAc3NAcA epimerase
MIHTGQHYDQNMSGSFFEDLEIPKPKYNLKISEKNHGAMTGKMIEAIEQILLSEQPHGVIVYGDTNSTLAGALAAAKIHIPVFHIEAGLRSFNKKMPEEINRVLTDHISSILFCPTHRAVLNLKQEGIVDGVIMVGDIMYDAALFALHKAQKDSSILKLLNLEGKKYNVSTIHRAENTNNPERLKAIFAYLEDEAKETPLIMPLHPRTKKYLEEYGIEVKHIKMIDPLKYFDMVLLASKAAQIFTDSGGLQKESYFYKVPCVTLRDETEWIETIEMGWNRLWATPTYKERQEIPEYGTGRTAIAIMNALGA